MEDVNKNDEYSIWEPTPEVIEVFEEANKISII